MSTLVDDMRVALAEVAPHLRGLISEPMAWGTYRVSERISFEDFVLIRRARWLVGPRHGRPTKHCDQCAWAAFQSDDEESAARLSRESCGHVGAPDEI